MTEEPLSGGNMQPVAKVGDTVRRVAGPWTEAVHALLEVLARGGVAEAPRALGIDDAGREVLAYLPGTILDDAPASVRWSEAMLAQAGRLLRRVHDASEALALDDRVWRTAVHVPVEVVCHNDFAPHNLLVQGELLRGIRRALEELAAFTDARAAETGRTDLPEHAAMHRRDAIRLAGLVRAAST